MASNLLGGLLGAIGMGGTAPKADATEATKATTDEADNARKARTALLETQGGIEGEELEEGQVKRRDNVFGN